ncbi:hypothetical protein L6452_09738 [Arctium lappa]|uniref:Uncharacterized protein n=1 Tax=Arctium lappa TaxID=4217 RepID=A0ACB9DKU7_ARCLA|nr:hypothetical protein L6452_09738 [Arctium lappa]
MAVVGGGQRLVVIFGQRNPNSAQSLHLHDADLSRCPLKPSSARTPHCLTAVTAHRHRLLDVILGSSLWKAIIFQFDNNGNAPIDSYM